MTDSDTWRSISGAVVLALGIVAGGMLVRQPATPSPAEPSVPAITPAVPATVAPSADLPGVPDAVTSVLEQSGNAGFADLSVTSQIPPSVVAVLVANGIPIAVPAGEDGP